MKSTSLLLHYSSKELASTNTAKFGATLLLTFSAICFTATAQDKAAPQDNGTIAGTSINHTESTMGSQQRPPNTMGEFLKSENDPGALPVRVVRIDIERPKYRNILMVWETAQEINNKQFQVMRSVDAQIWTNVFTIAGKGNSSEVTSYSYEGDISDALAAGVPQLYYRLVQHDFDGHKWESNIISIKLKDFKLAGEGLVVYPNPSHGNVVVSGFADAITVMDLSGRELGSYNSDNSSMEINNLQPGIYFLRSGTETRKLIIE